MLRHTHTRPRIATHHAPAPRYQQLIESIQQDVFPLRNHGTSKHLLPIACVIALLRNSKPTYLQFYCAGRGDGVDSKECSYLLLSTLIRYLQE